MDINQSFNNFEDAIKFFSNKGENFHVKITEGNNSLDKVLNHGNIVIYCGIGKRLKSGLPSGNQMWSNQFELFDKIQNNQVLVFHKKISGKVVCLGTYEYSDFKKKISFNGMTYFEIKLHRKKLLHKQEAILVEKDIFLSNNISYPSSIENNLSDNYI